MSISKKYFLWCLLNVVLTLPLVAQDGMGDALYRGNKMTAVVVVMTIILLGIGIFLIALERRIRKLEQSGEQETDSMA